MKAKKIFTIFLVLLIFLNGISCKKNEQSDGQLITPVEDFTIHRVEGTLHDVHTDFINNAGEFVVDGDTDYKIVSGSPDYGMAVSFIVKHINAATGAQLKNADISDVCVTEGKYIVFGADELFAEAGLTAPVDQNGNDLLGISGYYIKTVGDDVYAHFNTAHGAQMAAIALLREIVGYDMFSADCVIYERDGSLMPAMDITERPDYDYRMENNAMSDETAYGMGFTSVSPYISTERGATHNMYDFFTEDDLTANPEWFSADANLDDTIGQLCYTAHGDQDKYEQMTTRVAEEIEECLRLNPSSDSMRISVNDSVGANTTRRCTCSACNASYTYYGDTMSGAMLAFTNDVAEKVRRTIGEDRIFNLVLLAYHEAKTAPVQMDENKDYVLDANGKGVPVPRVDFNEAGIPIPAVDDDGNPVPLVCGPDVSIEFAASSANWVHSFYEAQNAGDAQTVAAWSGLGGSLYIWAYEISYYQYLYPYNSFDSLAENMRFFKEMGAKYIYWEGTWENSGNPGFALLRSYIDAKFMFDVNRNYADVVNTFFKYYFREAEPYMRTIFDMCQMNLRNKEAFVGGSVHSYALSDASVWPQGMINTFMSLIEQSYAAIEHYQEVDAEMYTMLYDHITIESLFPRYVLCTTYADTFNREELKTMRADFAEDFYAYGNTTHQEHYLIDAVFSSWNLD